MSKQDSKPQKSELVVYDYLSLVRDLLKVAKDSGLSKTDQRRAFKHAGKELGLELEFKGQKPPSSPSQGSSALVPPKVGKGKGPSPGRSSTGPARQPKAPHNEDPEVQKLQKKLNEILGEIRRINKMSPVDTDLLSKTVAARDECLRRLQDAKTEAKSRTQKSVDSQETKTDNTQ